MPPGLANALRELGEDARHVFDVLPASSPDETVLKRAGQEGWFVVSKDRKILRHPHERAVITELRLGVFFLDRNVDGLFPIAKAMINNWEAIKRIASTQPKPFLYLVKPRSVVPFRSKHVR